MNLRTYVGLIRSYFWVITVIPLLTVAVVVAGTARQTPVYAATAVVRLSFAGDSSGGLFQPEYARQVLSTAAYIVRSRPFLEKAIARLKLPVTPEGLAPAVSAQAVSGTPLLEITVESTSPVAAEGAANALAELLVEEGPSVYSGATEDMAAAAEQRLRELESQLQADRASLQSLLDPYAYAGPPYVPERYQVASPQDVLARAELDARADVLDLRARIAAEEVLYASLLQKRSSAAEAEWRLARSISIAAPASTPRYPIRPSLIRNAALAALLGALIGVFAAAALHRFDRRIRALADLEAAAGPLALAAVPSFTIPRRQRARAMLVGADKQPRAYSAFQLLASIVCSRSLAGARTLLITSVEPGAGKSTVVANLSWALASHGHKVAVVDADLREPCLDRVFGLGNSVGLSTLGLLPKPAQSRRQIEEALQQCQPEGVLLLASGPALDSHRRLPTYEELQELLGYLRSRCDIVLLDSPALQAWPDALHLAGAVDGALLVAARGQASEERIRMGLRLLGSVGAKVTGIVLNKASKDDCLPCSGASVHRTGSAATVAEVMPEDQAQP